LIAALAGLKQRLNFNFPTIFLLVAIIVVSFIAHIVFINQPFFMDEMPIIRNHLRFISKFTLMPDHAKYPTFFYYLSLPATAVSILSEYLSSGDETVSQVAARLFFMENQSLSLGTRILNVGIFFIAGAIAAAIIWRHINPVASLLTFVLLVSSPGLLEYTGYALPDTSLILLGALSLFFLYKVEGPEDRRAFFLSVAFAGLAISTKYNAVGLIFPAMIWGIVIFRESGLLFSRQFFSLVGISVLVLLGSFLAGSPGWVINPEFFLAELRYELDHARFGHFGATGVPVLGQFELLLRHLPVLFVFALPGSLLAIRTAPRQSILALSAVVGTFLIAAASRKQSFHYLFPAIPGIVVLAGYAVHGVLTRFEKFGLGFVICIGLFSAAISSTRAVAFLNENSTELAKQWIVANIPKGSVVATSWAYVPKLYSDSDLKSLRSSPLYMKVKGDPMKHEITYRTMYYEPVFSEVQSSGAEYLVVSSLVFDRFFNFGTFTKIEPGENDLTYKPFRSSQKFYRDLFSSPDWKIVFDADTGNGPRTFVLKRVGPHADNAPAPDSGSSDACATVAIC
jgi:Dolichyl-phosphate-mannose-protein mannosyltransferase